MKIEIADSCTNKEVFQSNLERIDYIIKDILKGVSLNSVESVVIADTEHKKYCESLLYYAKTINTTIVPDESETYLTSGKCINGIGKDGKFKQIIVLKSATINILIVDYAILCEKQEIDISQQYKTVQWLGITTILHEFGHAVDNENLFFTHNFINEEKCYDFSKESDFQKYFLEGAISLWGEFFAESFPYYMFPELRFLTSSKVNELINCISNYKGEDISANDRAFCIIYLFVHTIAELGYGNFDYSKLDSFPDYIPYLQAVENEMFYLLEKYPNISPDTDFNKLKIFFNRLCALK